MRKIIGFSKEEFINNIIHIEDAYLIYKDNDTYFLLSDMEYGGIIEKARVEEMFFKLDLNKGLSEELISCRGRHCGGITFIEYDNICDPTNFAIDDFMSLKDDSIAYLIGNEEELVDKIKSNNNKYFYFYIYFQRRSNQFCV